MTSRISTCRRWLIVGFVLVAVVIVSGALFVRRWRERGPDEASVSAAVDRFRSSSTTAGDAGIIAPEPGVYAYRGEGDERLSFMSTSQTQGPTMPATVVRDSNGCWTFEIEYNSFHRQSWEWCEVGGQLVERGGTTHQKFDFVAFKMDETSRLVCDPPFVALNPRAHESATAWRRTAPGIRRRPVRICRRSARCNTPAAANLDIVGRHVPALHYIADRTLTGDQSGREHVEMWFAERNGLPLRNEREIVVASPAPAPLNSVTYEERGHWQITNIEVQT